MAARPTNSRKGVPNAAPAPLHRPAARGRGRLSWAPAYALAAASAALFTLAFPPTEISFLAYLAPVPLVVMALRTPSRRHVLAAAYLGGLLFFGANLHWLWRFSTAGAIALILYLALYWAVFAWGLRRIGEATRLPATLVAPILWVALEYLRGWLLTGLPWVFAGHTQYENLVLIQTADAVGAYGPSFLIVMTAGLGADILTALGKGNGGLPPAARNGTAPAARNSMAPAARNGTAPAARNGTAPAGRTWWGAIFGPLASRNLVAAAVLVALAWAGTVGYGLWRLRQEATVPGPLVATVQTAIPQEVKLSARYDEAEEDERLMLQDQVRLTAEAAARAKAQGLGPLDLVCWPETMVPGFLDAEFLNADLEREVKVPALVRHLEETQARYREHWAEVRRTARRAAAPILCGAAWVKVEGVLRLPGDRVMPRTQRRNSAYLIAPDSADYVAEGTYSKCHLVPFGEFVPFRKSFPALYRLLSRMTPYPYDYSLTPGARDQPPLVLQYGGGEARFQAAICYEDAFAYRIRDMVRPRTPGRAKAVDFIVNISNDGWFVRVVRGPDGRIERLQETVEHKQHLNLCVFRAIEARVPIVRSVNTGVSAVIASDGRIVMAVRDPEGRGRCVAGEAIARLRFDPRVAPYARIGDALAYGCLGAAVLLGLAAAARGLRRRKERSP
jgi:apolipoprotein N-acyltransferase